MNEDVLKHFTETLEVERVKVDLAREQATLYQQECESVKATRAQMQQNELRRLGLVEREALAMERIAAALEALAKK